MKRVRALPGCLLMLLVAGCALPETEQTQISSVRFGNTSRPVGVERSNADLAEDFLDLTFGLESGEPITGMLRYEKPIRVYMSGPGLDVYQADLDALIGRLQREAEIDIARSRSGSGADILIEAVPSDQISRYFPEAACFIVPGEKNWQDFLGRPNDERLRWSDQTTLSGAVIFLPADTTPQDVRDCLNEELTQALGPANDLYRLPDSIWNDDNFHGAATSFDMMMLRTLYQPEFSSGMNRVEASRRVRRVLDRINPMGRDLPRERTTPESRAWAGAIETALSGGANREERLRAAYTSTQIALEMDPADHRLGVSLLTLGRLSIRRDPITAAQYFVDAYQHFRAVDGLEGIRTAQAGIHMAALALGTEQYDLAISLADRHIPAAIEGQNAILVAGFLSIKAEALAAEGRDAAARSARLDSLRWARYGFGDENGDLAREQAQLAAGASLATN